MIVSSFRTAALAMALIVLAAGCATKPGASGAGSEPRPPVVETLPNGLTLVVQEHRAADIVAVHLWVATGVRFEDPKGLGYAHFQEHMLFKGTDKFGPGHIDRAIEGTGGRSNAFTTYDYTTYQILVPSDATQDRRRPARRHGLPLEVRSQGDRPPSARSSSRRRASRRTTRAMRSSASVQHGLRRPSVRPAPARHAGDDERCDPEKSTGRSTAATTRPRT